MPNFIKTSSLWDVLSNQRASNLTVFAGLCISLFAVQFDVFTDVSVHVLASVVSLSAFVLTFNAPLGLLQFCTNPDLDVQPQVVMVADYPPRRLVLRTRLCRRWQRLYSGLRSTFLKSVYNSLIYCPFRSNQQTIRYSCGSQVVNLV
jgi:hypothetical protein